MFCSNCGKEIDSKTVFCSNCGKAVNSEPVINQPVLRRKKPFSSKLAIVAAIILPFLIPILFFAFVIPGDYVARMVAKSYLEEKYNESFEVTEIYHQTETWGDSYFTATCYPTNNPDMKFNVYFGSSDDPITDDYPGSSNQY